MVLDGRDQGRNNLLSVSKEEFVLPYTLILEGRMRGARQHTQRACRDYTQVDLIHVTDDEAPQAVADHQARPAPRDGDGCTVRACMPIWASTPEPSGTIGR